MTQRPDIEAIEARAEAATQGPWYRLEGPWLPIDCRTSVLADSPDPHVARVVCDFEVFGAEDPDENKVTDDWSDAAFIAHARTDIPALTAYARELEAEVKRLREALGFYADPHANPNEGPWGISSNDFGNVARAALEQKP